MVEAGPQGGAFWLHFGFEGSEMVLRLEFSCDVRVALVRVQGNVLTKIGERVQE